MPNLTKHGFLALVAVATALLSGCAGTQPQPSPAISPALSPSVSPAGSPKSIETGDLLIQVMDAGGSPLPGAKVVSAEQPEGQLKVTGMTRDDGSVLFTGIRAGTYDFYVNRYEYEQKSNIRIAVTAGQTTDFTVMLERYPPPSDTAKPASTP